MNILFYKAKLLCLPLILVILFFSASITHAQSYKWVKGGGSTSSLGTLGSDWSEHVKRMCTDDHGNVYVVAHMGSTNILADTFYKMAAHSTFGGSVHTFIASYTCEGMMRWGKLIEGHGESEVGEIAYYNGSIYYAGKSPSETLNYKYFGYDTVITNENYGSYLARFDTGNSGKMRWIRFIGANVYLNQTKSNAGTIAVDGQGYVHNFARIEAACSVTPTYVTTQPGTYDLKYDTTGNLLSVSHVTALDSVWMIRKMTYNKLSGKWFAAVGVNPNYWYAIHSSSNSAVCAFAPNNSLVWMDTTGNWGAVGSIDYKGGSDLYICAEGQGGITTSYNIGGITVNNTIGNAYSTVFKLDTNDIGKWAYNLMTTLSVCSFSDLSILAGDKIAVAGLFVGKAVHGSDTLTCGTGEGQNPIFIVMDTAGHTLKIDQLHGPGFYDYGTAIASDKIGNVYIGGQVEANITGGSLTPYFSNGGNTDYFIMKYGYDCACLSAPPPAANYTHTITTTGAYTVAFTYTGSAGYDSLRWNFGDGGTSTLATPTHTYAGTGTYTACVTVYTACGSNTYCNTISFSIGVQQPSAGNIQVYPNPTRDELIVSGLATSATYRLMNITGATIKQGSIQNNNGISLSECTPGIYIVELLQSDGTKNVVRVVKE
jgi:PKD repeat protein